jgi:hypothetical protein
MSCADFAEQLSHQFLIRSIPSDTPSLATAAQLRAIL